MARKFLNGLDAQNQRVINGTSAVALTDLPTWGQVQNLLNGLVWKQPVMAVATGNVNLSSPGASMDGYSFNVGDRFLAGSQSTASQNNVYVWQGASTPATVAPDFAQGEIGTGATVYAEFGSVNADTQWTLTTTGSITVGTTNLVFTKTGAGFVYSAGSNITISPTGVISATVPAAGPQKYSQTISNGGSATSIIVTHNLNTTDVIVQLYNVSTGELVDCDVPTRTTTTVTLAFGTAPASGTYRVVIIG